MKIHKLSFLLLLGLVVGLTSCLRDLKEDLDRVQDIEGVRWSPEIAAPLVSTRLTLGDILDQNPNNFITIDDDNLVHIIYRGNVASLEAKDFASIPEQKFDGTIALTPFHITQLQSQGSTSVAFSTIFNFGNENIEIDSLIMTSCALASTLRSTIQHDVSIKLDIPGITLNGIPFSRTFDLPYQAGGTDFYQTIQLKNHKFDLTKSGDQTYSQLLVFFELNVTEVPGNPVSPTDGVTFNTNFLYNQYDWMYGYVGNVDAAPDGADTLEFNIFDATNNGGTIGDFTISDPRLKVIYHNSYGIPIRAQIEELSTYRPKDGYTTLTGYPNPINMPTPSANQIGETLSDSFKLDKNNSNLPALLNGLPDKLLYDFGVELNPPGTTERNFILYNSKVDFEIDVDIPLHGSANGFAIEADEDIYLDFEDVEELESATIRLYTENDFPIDLGLQVYFIDSLNNVLDSLMEETALILESPGVDANGRVTGKTINTIDFVIPKDRLNRIRTAKTAKIRGTFNTFLPGGGVQPAVKFFSDYGVYVKLGVAGKALINYKFDDL